MYTFIVLAGAGLLGVFAYYLYIRQKGERLAKAERGVCPECGEHTVTVASTKGGGCSGTTNVRYVCEACGWEEEFNVAGGSCGI